MSAGDALTDEDRVLLDHIGDNIEAAEDEAELEELAENLREKIRDQRHQIRTLEQQFNEFQQSVEQRLSRLEERQAAGEKDEAVPLETWMQLDDQDRDEELSTSDQIALTIHEHWDEIAWTMGGGSNYAGTQNKQRVGVDTKTTANAKHNPSKLKHRLKTRLGFEPHQTQIYRGMKRLADATGGEEHVDEAAGRAHVIGGWYKYNEKAVADGSDTKRVLVRVDNE